MPCRVRNLLRTGQNVRNKLRTLRFMVLAKLKGERRSSATAPALLYLLRPCSRALTCARGIPFILNIRYYSAQH